MKEFTNEDLMSIVQARGTDAEAAFTEIDRRLRGPLTSYLIGRIHDRAWAEDLAQAAMARAWERSHQYRPTAGARFATWLHVVAWNLALTEFKRRRRTPVFIPIDPTADIDDGEIGIDPPAPEVDPLADRQADQAEQILLRALSRIDNDDLRIAVMLVDVWGFSYRETAQAMKCPLNTARTRIHRGRARLRRILARDPVAKLAA